MLDCYLLSKQELEINNLVFTSLGFTGHIKTLKQA